MVKCRICSQVEGGKKKIILKLDSLLKHIGLKNYGLNKLGVVVGDYFVNPSNVHVILFFLNATPSCLSVIDQLVNCGKVKKTKTLNLLPYGTSLNKVAQWLFQKLQGTFSILEGKILFSKALD